MTSAITSSLLHFPSHLPYPPLPFSILRTCTGCGIVEFSSPQEAQQAMTDLNDTEFMGRQVFIREDREEGVAGGGVGGGVGLAMVMAPR